MATTKKKQQSKEIPFRVRDLRGVREAEFSIFPGVNLFVGANGKGKTTSIASVQAAIAGTGEAVRKLGLGVREGARRGSIEGAGVTLTVGRKVEADGKASIEIADEARFSDLIRPHIAADAAREQARMRALLYFRPLAVDEEALAALAGGDIDLAAAVQGKHEGWADMSLLEVANAVKTMANALGLEQERAADRLAGEINHAMAELDPLREELAEDGPAESSLDLEQRYRDASQQLGRLKVEAEGRAALEAQQAEIRGSLGERPSLDDLDWQVGEAEEEEARLAKLLTAAQVTLAAARKAAEGGRTAALAWDSHQAILSRPLSGPTAEDVETAGRRLDNLTTQLDLARLAERAQQLLESAAVARKSKEAAVEAGERYREIAGSVPSQVAALLAAVDLPDLTIEDGRLAVILPATGEVRAWDDLSFGEQVRAASRIVLTAYREAESPVVVALAPEFWAALDHEHQRELAEIATTEGLYLLCEQPTEGELQVQHIDSNNAAELLLGQEVTA